MRLRSALGRARGLGSAREGVGHFYGQRATAIAMIPLLLTVATALYHAQLGVEVVIADYVHGETLKFTLLTASMLATVLMGVAMVVSILKVAVGV